MIGSFFSINILNRVGVGFYDYSLFGTGFLVKNGMTKGSDKQ